MKVLGNVNMLGNKIQSMSLENQNEYPSAPAIGSLEMIQKRLMLCVDVGNNPQDPLPVWIPQSSEVQMFRFNQPNNSTTWFVEHGLNNAAPVFQIYDVNGQILTPDEVVIVDADTLSITLNTPMQGSVTVLSGTMFGSPALSPVLTQQFTAATTWELAHNLGRIPTVRIYVNGAEIQAPVTADTSTVGVDFGTNSVAGTLLLF